MQKAGVNLGATPALAGPETDDLRPPLSSEQADRVFLEKYKKADNPATGLFVGLQPMHSDLFVP
ncbi:hypothetical protein QTI51_32090 [Variovorax sp. J22G73]|uniref:hypothetical protein n=1 Tax=unclassified Variovorax TaxID=663243 RepID=UPI002576B083|nr:MULTISPECIES: hypothetical protein [unclassified Variovorax]MDM0009449.1 hypothetical protein [Variovorax sp. J22R203]MDM0101956.1 hypothetical protein [Variovorax sp. J22G73]